MCSSDLSSKTPEAPGGSRGDDARAKRNDVVWAIDGMVMGRVIPSLPRGAFGESQIDRDSNLGRMRSLRLRLTRFGPRHKFRRSPFQPPNFRTFSLSLPSKQAGSHPAPDDAKERVRDATDIVDLVGTYISLRRAGKAMVGLCPWHDDSRPSFQVNPERQTFRCWV